MHLGSRGFLGVVARALVPPSRTCKYPCSVGARAAGFCPQPNECQCMPGYVGHDCSSPLCLSPCFHGTCTAPGVCTCEKNYHGGLNVDACRYVMGYEPFRLGGKPHQLITRRIQIERCIHLGAGFVGYSLGNGGRSCIASTSD